jgi:hypothetical protein
MLTKGSDAVGLVLAVLDHHKRIQPEDFKKVISKTQDQSHCIKKKKKKKKKKNKKLTIRIFDAE